MLTKTFLLAAATAATLCFSGAGASEAAPVRNIILVHGAWVDGSGWKGVFEILRKDGYQVTLVQEPLTSFDADVAATKRVIDLQQGPAILVAHSYGGSVITEAGNAQKVAGLVYIAAHEPDAGENEAANGKAYPTPLSKAHAIEKTADGFTYLDPQRFPSLFAADLPIQQATFEAQSQILTSANVFSAPISNPAWRHKPSWTLVAGSDEIISPNLERMYAKRAGSHVVEVPGASHSVYETHPKEVAALIEQAARNAQP
jgi:pimeloyl-ACP methyl ester carboxylesterase